MSHEILSTTPTKLAAPTTTSVVASFDDLLELLTERLAPPAELLTRESFAALLDMGVSTFDRLRETGDIGPRPVRLGGGLRWHRDEVRTWLKHRDPAGELHDAKTWPTIWQAICRRTQK